MHQNEQKHTEQVRKMDEKKLEKLLSLASGEGMHDSLSNAWLYAAISADLNMADFLAEKDGERCDCIRELRKLNVESGYMLLPEIPHDDLGAFMAIEKLAKTNPGAHELLGKIAELDKLRYMVGNQDTRVN